MTLNSILGIVKRSVKCSSTASEKQSGSPASLLQNLGSQNENLCFSGMFTILRFQISAVILSHLLQWSQTLQNAPIRCQDRETLVEMLATDPRSLSGSPASLLQILGSQNENLCFSGLEEHSRGWIKSASVMLNLRDSLEAAVIANHCRRENRIDLAFLDLSFFSLDHHWQPPMARHLCPSRRVRWPLSDKARAMF